MASPGERKRQTRAVAWGVGGSVCVCAHAKGLDGENRWGRSVQSSGFVCQVVFCGGGSHVSAFTEKIKSRHEFLPLKQSTLRPTALSRTRLREHAGSSPVDRECVRL